MEIFYQILASLIIFILSSNHMSKAETMYQVTSSIPLSCDNETKQNLRQALSKNSLSGWPLKHRYSSLRELEFDKNNFWSAIENENNERLDRILTKVWRGEVVNLVVYGGSNTAGGGIQEDEKSVYGRFPFILQSWWENVITPLTGSRLNMKVIGIGGTSSSFYQFCYKVYLNGTDIDLAILDASVNDAVAIRFQNSTANQSLPLEQFTRELLNEVNKPAVMFVNFFLTRLPHLGCFNLMDRGQSLVSNHYNITTFNLRDLACNHKPGKFQVTSKTNKHQTKDKYHISLLGHAQTAFMIIQVISKSIKRVLNQIDKNDVGCTTSPKMSQPEPLPSPKYIKLPSGIIRNPVCWTGLSPDDKKNKPRNSLKVSVLKTKGFAYSNHILIHGPKHKLKSHRMDCYSCLSGKKKNSEITLSFVVPSTEKKLSSVSLITRSKPHHGEVEIWLDEKFDKRVRIHLKCFHHQTVVVAVATEVKPGNHTLTVRITKDGYIPIVGIAVAEYLINSLVKNVNFIL